MMNSPFKTTIKNYDEIKNKLFDWFERCGYIRRQNSVRRANEGRNYKKGYEVRFVLQSKGEVRSVRALLKKVRLYPGTPFDKHSRIVLPVYGREAVEWFIEQLGPNPEERGFGPDGRRLVQRSWAKNSGSQ